MAYGAQVISRLAYPANPIYLGTYDTPGQATAVRRSDSRLCVADDSGGLQILQAVEGV